MPVLERRSRPSAKYGLAKGAGLSCGDRGLELACMVSSDGSPPCLKFVLPAGLVPRLLGI